jgi:3-deoxy-D-arabino-heptulosonate 7-phosphate (DAHP) synthase class II
VALCGALNPDRVPGRLTLICQMGAERVVSVLPPLLMAARAAGQPAVWVCDPIHGNRPRSGEQDEGQRLDDLLAEIRGFLAAHADAGTWPGGVYLPLTGYHPMDRPDRAALDRTRRFTKVDDPGLSPGQALELAFRLAELLREL